MPILNGINMNQWLTSFIKNSFLKTRIDNYVRNRIREELKNNFKYYQLSYEWQIAALHEKEYIDKLLEPGVKIRCYLDGLISKLIYIEQFEQTEINFIRKFIRAGDIFLDIGANIGFHTLIAAKKTGSAGKVYAFEPFPNTFNRLTENVLLNNLQNVEAIPLALSNAVGKQSFYSFKDGMDAFNSFAPILEQTSYDKIDVHATTLNAFISNLPVELISKISLIKIDVEGWEIPVLEGGYDLLAKPDAPDLLVEFTEQNAQAAGRKCSDLFSLGERLGYKWYQLENNDIIESRQKKYFPYQNLIATKNKSAVQERIKVQ